MATLEQIAKEYGMTEDYVDPNTGNIYQLTDAIDDGEGNLLVPITAPYGDSILLGYAKMQKPERIGGINKCQSKKEKC